MKKYMLMIVLVAAVLLTSCSNPAAEKKNDVSLSGSITQVSEITTDAEIEEQAENTTTEPSSEKISTTKKAEKSETTTQNTTTQKSTTTKKQTTTKKAEKTTKKTEKTTKKKKETTTKKKQTTTKAKTCTNNGNHSLSCGNMGRWFNSKSDVKAYVDKEMKYWADLEESGKITREEYYKKCPSGYECWSCSYCGKWTGNFKY